MWDPLVTSWSVWEKTEKLHGGKLCRFNCFNQWPHARACNGVACTLQNIGLSTQINFHICTVSWPRAARPIPALLFTRTSPCTRTHIPCTHSIASHTHARRLLQALQMCVLDLLPTQATLMPVCWLRLFHTLWWNERRRRWSPPIARVPDSSHGFKVRPVSDCLPATQSFRRYLSPVGWIRVHVNPRWSSRAS